LMLNACLAHVRMNTVSASPAALKRGGGRNTNTFEDSIA
jgi:hypothetical protein